MIHVDTTEIDFKEIVDATASNVTRCVDRELGSPILQCEREFYESIRASLAGWLMLSPSAIEQKFKWMMDKHEAFTVYASGRLDSMTGHLDAVRLRHYEKEWGRHLGTKKGVSSGRKSNVPRHCKCKYCTVSQRAKRVFSWATFTRKKAEEGRSLAARFVRKIGLVVCPYCARNYIAPLHVGEDDIYRPDLDHFYAQSIYPYFGLCLNNLIPSCSACNFRIKHDADFMLKGYFHPYLNEVPEGLFSVEGFGLIESEVVRSESIKIKINDSLNESVARSAEFFHLKLAYDVHVGEVSDFVTSLRVYPDEVLEERAQAIGVDPTLFKLSLRRSTNADVEYKKRPLGKLLRDLYQFATIKRPI